MFLYRVKMFSKLTKNVFKNGKTFLYRVKMFSNLTKNVFILGKNVFKVN